MPAFAGMTHEQHFGADCAMHGHLVSCQTRCSWGRGGNAMPEPARAKPKPTPETRHFWDGTQAGELRLQRCDACAHAYFPPRPFCPSCASRKVSVFKASGKGKLYSYIIHHRPAPGFTPPYSIAVVQLDEGPRM